MGQHDIRPPRNRPRSNRVAAGAVALALTATLVQSQVGGGSTANAVDLAAVASGLAQEPGIASAVAAADYFLKLDGIPGESLDKVHRDTIEIDSFSWGATNPGSSGAGGGMGAGKVSFSDLSVSTSMSKASPRLMLASAAGTRIPSVVLYGRGRGGSAPADYLVVTLSDVFVSSYQSSAGGETPTDQFSLTFAKISFSYRPQTSTGALGPAVVAGWDLKAAKKL